MFGYKDPLRQMKMVGGNGMAIGGRLLFKIILWMFIIGMVGRVFGG